VYDVVVKKVKFAIISWWAYCLHYKRKSKNY